MNRSMIIFILIIVIFFGILIVLLSFNGNNGGVKEEVNIKNVSASIFKKDIDSNSDIVLIDVRTPEEFSEGSISGAINIDFENSNFRESIGDLDKEKEYYVYCRSGNRSGQTVNIMKEMGFKNITNLTGGILSWTSNGYNLNTCKDC